MNAAPESASSPLPLAPGLVWRRIAWLLALLPGAAARAWIDGPMFAGHLALALGCALAADALCRRARASGPANGTLQATAYALLLVFCLPASAPGWLPASGAALAAFVAQFTPVDADRPRFHPAMAALAMLAALFPERLVHTPDASGDAVVALGYALGGLALAGFGRVRGSIPLFLLGTALALTLAWHELASATPLSSEPMALWLLTAFFIATEPASGCTTRRGRGLFAAGIALLGFAAQRLGSSPVAAIAGSVLLMNAIAPWIDRHTEPPAWRRQAIP
jgi:electron transport complex protein RnfD